MIDLRLLQIMYQQWCQGNSDIKYRWIDFVESSARSMAADPADVMRELQKCSWFDWEREE
jgi:hypothetical protein